MLFDKQLDFVNDPSRHKTALCSRRAGKTTSAIIDLANTALTKPRSISVYVALTRLSAKRIVWSPFKDLNYNEQLNAKFNSTELTITFPNESQVWVIGCDDVAQIERLRGSGYHLVYIDEGASFGPHLAELVDEVIEPATAQYRGTTCLIGTPGAACFGKFYDASATRNKVWSNHTWTILDNPYFPDADEYLTELRERNEWTEDHPIYRREWLAEWVWDASDLVYRYAKKNIVDKLPARDWTHTLGCDLGFNDDTAFSIVSASTEHPDCYIHSSWKSPKLDITAVANKIREYLGQWEINTVVVDSGGIGRMVVEELSTRHNLPVKAAEKTDKFSAIEFLNGDLFSGRAKVLANDAVLKEWDQLKWHESRRKEDPRYPNHISDAVSYAYREALHWAYRPTVVPPTRYTKEFWNKLEDEMEEERGESLHGMG